MERSRRACLFPRTPSPTRLALGFPLLAFALGLATRSEAGPNAGGVVILHRNASLTYTIGANFCGVSGITKCEDAVTSASPGIPVVLHALAAFPGNHFPRLSGITIGVNYDATKVFVAHWGACGDFSLPTSGWPGPNEGLAMTWNQPKTGYLTEVCWFDAYAYTGPTTFKLVPHPTGGSSFADDSVPSIIDPVAGYGQFGFIASGQLPCPTPPPIPSTLKLSPSNLTVYQPCGGSFGIDLTIDGIYELAGFEACVGFDPTRLDVESVVIDSTFLGSSGRTVYPLSPVSCSPSCQTAGTRFGAITTGSQVPPSGAGRLATIRFSPQGSGSGTDSLCIGSYELTNAQIPPISIPVTHVKGAQLTQRATCYGDFNSDGDVSVFDLVQIIPKWRCCVGAACYSPTYDVNLLARGEYCASVADGCIDLVDIQTVAGMWHRGCPGTPGAIGPPPLVNPSLKVSPPSGIANRVVDDTLSVSVVINQATNFGGYEIGLTFDPTVVTAQSVVTGSFPASTGRAVYALPAQIDNGTGVVHFGACSTGLMNGASGSGVLARVVFTVLRCDATTALGLIDAKVTTVDGWPVTLQAVTGGSRQVACAVDVEEGATDPSLSLLPPRPNPLTSTTEFTFSLPETNGDRAVAQLSVFSVSGREVRRLLDQPATAGIHRLRWDGRDDTGRLLPSGAYYCRLTFDGRELTRQLQLVK